MDQVDMNGTDPLRELPRSMCLQKTLLVVKNPVCLGRHFCTCLPLIRCMSERVLPITLPVTHVFHLVMEASAMPMGICSTRAHLVAIWVSAETLAHLWTVLAARLGLNDLHNASEKPHRCFWKEEPLYDVCQPMRTSLKIFITCSSESCGHGICRSVLREKRLFT